MKLHVVVIAFERTIPLRGLIDCFLIQSNPNWVMTIVHDGPASPGVKEIIKLYKDDNRVSFLATEVRQQNWGHANRKAMLDMLTGDPGDFVLITNDDNAYIPRFIEFMFREIVKGGVGMVYCDFLHHNFEYDIVPAIPKVNNIDMGAFIVELKLAQSVGFVHDVPEADGLFAEECAAKCKEKGLKAVHIPKVLFIHN
jgi:hypothetical protein